MVHDKTLEKALQDIESKRHKTNPFDERYLGLCLSAFAQACTSGWGSKYDTRCWPSTWPCVTFSNKVLGLAGGKRHACFRQRPHLGGERC